MKAATQEATLSAVLVDPARLFRPLKLELPSQLPKYEPADEATMYTDFTEQVDRLIGSKQQEQISSEIKVGAAAIRLTADRQIRFVEAERGDWLPDGNEGPYCSLHITLPMTLVGIESEILENLSIDARQTERGASGPEPYRSLSIKYEATVPTTPLLSAFGAPDGNTEFGIFNRFGAGNMELRGYRSGVYSEAGGDIVGSGIALLRVLEPDMFTPVS